MVVEVAMASPAMMACISAEWHGKSSAGESCHTGQHKRRYRSAAGVDQAPRRLGEGGACCHHIVNQQNRSAAEARNRWRWYGKGAGNIALSLMPAKPALALCCPLPDQHFRRKMTNAGLVAQTARPFRRLVVASPEIAP